jgi:hypothetical protein
MMQRILQAIPNPSYTLTSQDVAILCIGLVLVEGSNSRHKSRAQELQRILNTLQTEHGTIAISKGRLK